MYNIFILTVRFLQTRLAQIIILVALALDDTARGARELLCSPYFDHTSSSASQFSQDLVMTAHTPDTKLADDCSFSSIDTSANMNVFPRC